MGKLKMGNSVVTSEPRSSRNGSSGPALFQCQGFGDCRMVFTRSEHLARHIRKHTGERPFQCHCLKNFSRLDNLRQHCQTVHEDKPELNEKLLQKLASIHSNMSSANKVSSVNGKVDMKDHQKKRKADSEPFNLNGIESKRMAHMADLPLIDSKSSAKSNQVTQTRPSNDMETNLSSAFANATDYMIPTLARQPPPATNQAGSCTPVSGRISPPYFFANYIRPNSISEAPRYPGSYWPASFSFTRPPISKNSRTYLQPSSSIASGASLQYSPFHDTPAPPSIRSGLNNGMALNKHALRAPSQNDREKLVPLPSMLDRYSKERSQITSSSALESNPTSLKHWSLASTKQGQKSSSMLTPVHYSKLKRSSLEPRHSNAPYTAPILDSDRSRLYAPYLLSRQDVPAPKTIPERYPFMNKYHSTRYRLPTQSACQRLPRNLTSNETLSTSLPVSSGTRFTPWSTVKAQNPQNTFAIP